MAISNDEFRNALRHWASGVTVITTKDATGKSHGITVSAFSSVSLSPPLVLVCIDKETGSHYAFLESGAFVVNILREDQQAISQQFAAKIEDKFDCINCEIGINGIPLLSDSLANLECTLVHSYEGGDHTIFIGEIQKATVHEGKPLLYYNGSYRNISEK